jgi:ADP-ribose pyrophosphatase YjhB (NUDIX family)
MPSAIVSTFTVQKINLKVIKIGYCSIAACLVSDPAKVLYFHKFPPMLGTTNCPLLSRPSDPEETLVDDITREELIAFWSSPDIYQTNGSWKGGAWSLNNLPTTDPNWMTGIFIGDIVSITPARDGIVKFNGGNYFHPYTENIPGSEVNAWSCNASWNEKTYGVYLTENSMPQSAIDVMVVTRVKAQIAGLQINKRYIKMLRRGDNAATDMPKSVMIAAGEHLEPGKDEVKARAIVRAVQEEIGMTKINLENCFKFELGVFNEPGRDPRYWQYSIMREGKLKTFGMKRYSKSAGYLLYLEMTINPDIIAEFEANLTTNSNVEKFIQDQFPNVQHEDTVEVGQKWLYDLDRVLSDFPVQEWMLSDHQKLVKASIGVIEAFTSLSPESKEETRFKF